MSHRDGLVEAGEALDRASIPWAVLRLALDSGAPLGDVDLLVEPGRLEDAVHALAARGFVPLPWSPPPSRGLIRYEPASDTWTWLDVQDHVAIRGRRLPRRVVVACLSRRIHVDGIWLLAPADEFWGLLARHLADGHPLQERHRRRLVTLLPATRPDDPLALWLERRTGRRGLAAAAHRSVSAGAWAHVHALASGGSPRRRAASVLARAAGAWRAASNPAHRGLSIALLGPDGAGKSSLAATLASRLPFSVRRIYMGVSPPSASQARQPVLAMLVALAGLGTQWRRYLVGRYHQFRGRTVIFDRYMEDPWLPAPRNASLFRRARRRTRAALSCPPADVMLVLDAPGADLFARKGEHDPRSLEEQRLRYRRLGERVPNVYVIDGTAGREAVARQAVAVFWRRFRQRVGAPWHHQDETGAVQISTID